MKASRTDIPLLFPYFQSGSSGAKYRKIADIKFRADIHKRIRQTNLNACSSRSVCIVLSILHQPSTDLYVKANGLKSLPVSWKNLLKNS